MKTLQSMNVHSKHLRTIVRTTIGLLTGAAGLADMLSAIVPKLNWNILLGTWPLDVHTSVHGLTVVVGFFLVMLSYGLMRGKSQAWLITIVLLLLSALLHVLRGGSVLASVVALVLTALLGGFSHYFQARSDPPSIWRGYIALVVGVGLVTFYTIGGFIALYSQFEGLIDRFGFDVVLLRLITHAHMHLPPGTQAFFFERALPLLCLSAVAYGMLKLLHPVTSALLPNEAIRRDVACIISAFGKNSISYFALGEDKTYFFSSSKRTVISYVLEGDVAVVAGDPIGPEEELLPALEEFMVFCQQQDWTLVLWQVRDDLADIYRKVGLRLLKIGEDAVIDPRCFTLKGGAMANVRSSMKRAEKDGVHVIFYRGRVEDLYLRIQMEQISRSWLTNKGGSEMNFSMGHFDPEGDNAQWTALAIDHTRRVHAFVTFVPIYGRHGWGVDLMRRSEQSAPGTMELLLVRSIEHLKQCGAEMISLGLAPLSNVNNNSETFLDTSIDFLTQRFGNLSHSQSLFKFKQKFQPKWESRYLAFSNTLILPKIGWALYAAHQYDTITWVSMLRKSLAGRRRQLAPSNSLPRRATGTLSL